MGTVFGSIFSNFYMSDLENKLFNSIKKEVTIYLRYEINILQDTFQNHSVPRTKQKQ